MWRRLNSSSACFSSSPGGSSAASRRVSTAQRGALVGVELRIRLARPGGLCERVLEREHPAPGRAEEVDLVEPEPVADALHLLDEGLDRPERRVVGPRRLTAAELVEEARPPALLGERRRAPRAARAATRPAVQASNGNRPGLRRRRRHGRRSASRGTEGWRSSTNSVVWVPRTTAHDVKSGRRRPRLRLSQTVISVTRSTKGIFSCSIPPVAHASSKASVNVRQRSCTC